MLRVQADGCRDIDLFSKLKEIVLLGFALVGRKLQPSDEGFGEGITFLSALFYRHFYSVSFAAGLALLLPTHKRNR